uniref:Nuclear transcription factor Y subunit beta-like n=1 Tax=Sinocyclocheilus rhinocerous TaxID=307959 RepID=A0A673JT43_9TELE
MEGDSSTTDTTQLGITGEYMTGGTYVLQTQDDDGDESFNDHEDGNGSKDYFREQDIYLPIANVARIMKNAIPQTGKIAKEAKECVQECDILFAMSTLGFDMYVEPLKLYLQKFREAMKGEKGITPVAVSEGLGEELTDDSFTGQLPAGLITADGQQQNVMVYTTSYQQIPGVQQIQFS